MDCKISIFDSIAEQLSVFFYGVKIYFTTENTSGRRDLCNKKDVHFFSA